MRLVAALGGNALLRPGEAPTVANQRARLEGAADGLARLAQGNDLVITHGNGPQLGWLALQAEALAGSAPVPLDVLDAETEGLLGYLIIETLQRRLPDRQIVALLTRIAVERADPAFAHPVKPVGPHYSKTEATALAAARGWAFARTQTGSRRVVPSPEPLAVLERAAIARLLDAGTVVICAGGGGIPVARDTQGHYAGVEAVIDKDLASALLARELAADALLLLTDVAAVQTGYGTPAAQALGRLDVASLRALDFEREFAAGSMRPKVEAACRFVERGGKFAAIGRLEDAILLAAGRAGTVIGAR
jgi:carbamate kinase